MGYGSVSSKLCHLSYRCPAISSQPKPGVRRKPRVGTSWWTARQARHKVDAADNQVLRCLAPRLETRWISIDTLPSPSPDPTPVIVFITTGATLKGDKKGTYPNHTLDSHNTLEVVGGPGPATKRPCRDHS